MSRPLQPRPSPAATARGSSSAPPPRTAYSEATRASKGPGFEGEEGPEVIRVRSHSATRSATTWEKSFQLCPWGLPMPPVEQRPTLWHPLPCLSPPVVTPSQRSPLVSSLKSLLPSLRRSPKENTLGASREGGWGVSVGGPAVGGRETSVPRTVRGCAARSWEPEVDRGQWPARIPSATGGIISRLPQPRAPTLRGSQPTPRG